MDIKIIKYPASSLRMPVELVPLPRPVYPRSFADHVTQLKVALAQEADGLAIASNQISEHGWRVFVVDTKKVDFPLDVVVNPSWKPQAASQMETQVEGCLSFPGMSFPIKRHNFIIMECQDIHGNVQQHQVEGLAARMVQHECDHLDGKLFIEQLPKKVQIDVRNEVIKRRKAGRW